MDDPPVGPSRQGGPARGVVLVAADAALLDAALESDAALAAALGHAVVPGWATFTEALPIVRAALDATPWGPRLFVADGELVGWGGFKGPPAGGVVELGYEIAASRRGRGLATAAVRAMLAEAAGDAVETVIAHTLPERNASVRVLERCGFAFAGEVDGTWRFARPPGQLM